MRVMQVNPVNVNSINQNKKQQTNIKNNQPAFGMNIDILDPRVKARLILKGEGFIEEILAGLQDIHSKFINIPGDIEVGLFKTEGKLEKMGVKNISVELPEYIDSSEKIDLMGNPEYKKHLLTNVATACKKTKTLYGTKIQLIKIQDKYKIPIGPLKCPNGELLSDANAITSFSRELIKKTKLLAKILSESDIADRVSIGISDSVLSVHDKSFNPKVKFSINIRINDNVFIDDKVFAKKAKEVINQFPKVLKGPKANEFYAKFNNLDDALKEFNSPA